MDITPYVDSLRRDLVAAAEAGDEQTRAAAERLTLALGPAVRLALMEAISQAAAEITTEMRAGSVDVRLDGRDLDFVVDSPAELPDQPTTPATPAAAAAATAADEPDDDDGAIARVTLRLPEAVKARAEEFAARTGHSLNTWLVGVVRDATRESAVRVDVDLSSIPFAGGFDPFGPPHKTTRRMTGWV
ncbi:pilus assembly protein HicB [Nocardioides speluncae]|uniref:pilus assembly protein HicB n=1 Tax=Nocardioides speluncae TaxID=2670337 RepID=UPI000D68EAFF|nr:pilus assembly protein HicB [Nocardioides speluncae]